MKVINNRIHHGSFIRQNLIILDKNPVVMACRQALSRVRGKHDGTIHEEKLLIRVRVRDRVRVGVNVVVFMNGTVTLSNIE